MPKVNLALIGCGSNTAAARGQRLSSKSSLKFTRTFTKCWRMNLRSMLWISVYVMQSTMRSHVLVLREFLKDKKKLDMFTLRLAIS